MFSLHAILLIIKGENDCKKNSFSLKKLERKIAGIIKNDV